MFQDYNLFLFTFFKSFEDDVHLVAVEVFDQLVTVSEVAIPIWASSKASPLQTNPFVHIEGVSYFPGAVHVEDFSDFYTA